MSNTVTAVVPMIFARGIQALRQYAVLPRCIRTDFGTEVAQKGATISVPKYTAMSATSVTAGTAVTPVNAVPTTVDISLSNWYETGFTLSDKEIAEIDDKGFLVGQSSHALKALVNKVEETIIAKSVKFYGTTGTSGTTPSTVSDIINCRKLLNQQLAPAEDRFLFIDGAAEANFLGLSLFTSRADTGDDALITGSLGKRFGFNIIHDQNMEGNSFTTTGGTAYENHGGASIGATTMTVEDGSNDFKDGEVWTIAGDTQQYVATGALSSTTLSFYPALKVAAHDNDAITFFGSMAQQNLAFQRDAFFLATRPLARPADFPNVISMSDVDPVSGLALRLEVEHTNKLTRWTWDILWGVEVGNREYGVRLVG